MVFGDTCKVKVNTFPPHNRPSINDPQSDHDIPATNLPPSSQQLLSHPAQPLPPQPVAAAHQCVDIHIGHDPARIQPREQQLGNRGP